MKKLKLLIKVFILFKKINYFNFFKFYDKKSKNIIWVNQSFPRETLSYLSGNSVINDLAIINSFLTQNIKFSILIGAKIGSTNNKKIFYSINRNFDFFQLTNNSSVIRNVIREVEKQGNVLFPSYDDLLYWENKDYMHQQFDDLNISSPLTEVFFLNNTSFVSKLNIKFPLILKELNSSGSRGLYHVLNSNELKILVIKLRNSGIDKVLIQEFLDIRKDLRVILVNSKIESFYWRINKSKSWKPTSTGFGSVADFSSFPNQWKEFIENSFKKLNISTGAFDIAWRDDDLSTPPLILEVSSSYMPNPILPKKNLELEYSEFKKTSFLKRNGYYQRYIDEVFRLKDLLIKFNMSKS